MSYRYIEKEYDVVVVGGGMAGICAAISSARQGAATAMIQARSMYGGNASSEIRMHIVGANCHMSKFDVSETGILLEILLANKARNPNQSFSVWDGVLWEKVRFQENLDSYLNTCMDQVHMDGSVIRSIRCYQNTTETEYKITGTIFIDATGHGTLGAMAGAESRMGSEGKDSYGEPNAPEVENRDTMGNTLMFHAVDAGHPVAFKKPFWAYKFSEEDLKYRHHYNCISAFRDDGSAVEFKEGQSQHLPEFSDMDSGYWWIELGGQYEDIIAEGETIRDELLKCVYGVWDHIKNDEDHGAANYVLDWVGMVPGYRESRRLMGDYVLTEHDISSNKVFEDAVAYGGWPMDEHVRGGIMDVDKYPSRVMNFDGIYTIPYRCYYSKNVDNLMMVGRNISTSKMAFGSTRVMGTCAVGGQAVGTAAALAVKYSCMPKGVQQHMEELQQVLIKEDCFIPGFQNCDEQDLARQAMVTASGCTVGYQATAVIKGPTRHWQERDHCWESDFLDLKEARLELCLHKRTMVEEIRLVFDPNLNRELMPSMTSAVRNRQTEWMPEELVRDYRITLKLQGEEVHSVQIKDNEKRLNCVTLLEPIAADLVVIQIEQTYGYPRARIYEVRIYGVEESDKR